MGGFTVNGCGVGDSFYPKLSLGQHYCRVCGSIQEYSLMEVQRKIKVFFVPTVSINTKYAVACKKCKNGFYITDEQREALWYRNAQIEVTEGEIAIKKSGTISAEPVKMQVAKGNAPCCPKCGKEQPMKGKFCVFCGEVVLSESPVCKNCGAPMQSDQIYCFECGMKL